MNTPNLLQGDCLQILPSLPSNHFHAVITDPPYGISFMNSHWDIQVPGIDVWKECLRVLRPGGHLLAFASTRTQHRMASAIEDAGFEIRDMIAWVYGSGFPKSHDVSKAIDKEAGAERKVIGTLPAGSGPLKTGHVHKGGGGGMSIGTQRSPELNITTAATDAAREWDGWGTALKPALEPITLARKPLSEKTVAQNTLRWQTGALNIDACRIPHQEPSKTTNRKQRAAGWNPDNCGLDSTNNNTASASQKGRWPANLIHDGHQLVLDLFPSNAGAAAPVKKGHDGKSRGIYGDYAQRGDDGATFYSDQGSAARFFYCPKASPSEREYGLDHMEIVQYGQSGGAQGAISKGQDTYEDKATASTGLNVIKSRRNNHPTVKPIALMAYLCQLITPPSGSILDPFMGTGTTGIAAISHHFHFTGIELDPRFFQIAQSRIAPFA